MAVRQGATTRSRGVQRAGVDLIAAQASILIVDDEPLNRMLRSRDIERQGHLADTVADGGQALEAPRAEPSDVVLLDVLMPEVAGYETQRMSRA